MRDGPDMQAFQDAGSPEDRGSLEDQDPLDAGIQAAQLAAAILRDPATGGMRTVQPDHPKLVLNLNTAEYLGLTLAPDLVRMASRLYGGPGAFASQDSDKPIVP